MQKWEKLLLIVLFILAMLGALIGFAMNKSGIGEMIILANIDSFGFIELILLLLAISCTSLDIYETYESKNQFGPAKFNIILNSKNRLKNVIIVLVLAGILEFGLFLNSMDTHILPLFLITLMLIIILVFHIRIDNIIGENGILYCGIYHSWDEIKSHKLENDTLLEFNVLIMFFGFEYNNIIKFSFYEKDKDDIKNFLAEKIV